MNTRIRYINQGDGTYVSSRYIKIKDGEARVSLQPQTKEGIIHISGGPDIRVTGTSLHKIKIAVKNKLTELGAEFADETREVGRE